MLLYSHSQALTHEYPNFPGHRRRQKTRRYTPRNHPLTSFPVHDQSLIRAITQPDLSHTSPTRAGDIPRNRPTQRSPAYQREKAVSPNHYYTANYTRTPPRQPTQPAANISSRSFILAGRKIRTNSRTELHRGGKTHRQTRRSFGMIRSEMSGVATVCLAWSSEARLAVWSFASDRV